MDDILTSLDWDDLRIFLAVKRAGSIRGAARNVGKTHATVSRHVKSLQTALASPLFERRREGQCLTDLGGRILPLAEHIEKTIAEIDRAAFSVDTGLAGTVKLSLSESLYTAFLYKSIDEFMLQYPMIELDILATDQLSKLAWREADVVIRITKTPPDTAYGRKLADSPLAVFASKDYLANRPKRDRWISLSYPPASKPVIPARIVARTDAPALAARLIQLGRGIGILPCYMSAAYSGLCRVEEIPLIPDMQIWVLTHEDLRSNPRVRALMDHLYAALEQYRSTIEHA